MSSSNKKTFKTSENSKQAGATVTSDAILLDPTTTDHILVVTADSNANLSGNVDVALEMSPDGQNWCPAKIKQTTVTEGGTTDPVLGNEKAVDLAADPTVTSEYKNKFARGRLEYDISTNQEYTGSTVDERQRQDAVDFMHHMIGTTKNFNYSGWYKSDVQPSTTYTPVLFRNGGLDPFENTQVVDLTDANRHGWTSTYLYRPSSPTVADDWLKSPDSIVSDLDLRNGVSAAFSGYGYAYYAIDIPRLCGMEFTDGSYWYLQAAPAGSYGRLYLVYDNVGVGSGTIEASLPSAISGFNINASMFINIAVDVQNLTIYVTGWAHTLSSTMYELSIPFTLADTSVLDFTSKTVDHSYLYDKFTIGGSNATGFNNRTAYHAAAASSGVKRLNDPNGYDPQTKQISSAIIEAGHEHIFFPGSGTYDQPTASLPVVKPYNSNTGPTFTMYDPDSSGAWSFVSNSPTPASVYGGQVYDDVQVIEKITQNLCEPATLPFSSVFLASNSFSISGWFKTEVGATGTLFSNGPLTSSSGLNLDITSNTYITLKLGTYSNTINCGPVILNDGKWHHIVLTRTPTGTYGYYVDGKSEGIAGYPNVDPKGSYGFTLLGDGQNNATATSPSSTDTSKLNASLSNWSIHSETLSSNAAAQLYSNGHVRNTMNLPAVDSTKVEAYWQLNDGANPEQDSSGNGHHLTYQDGHTITETLVQQLVSATGATLVQNTLNGHGITLSLTKNFDYSTGWVSDASGEASICLSFNGFERDAEFTALWKCNQVSKGINLLDGNWHNIILSYRGKNDSQSSDETTSSYVQEGDIVRFGPDTTAQNFNFNLSIDGVELNDINNGIGADQIFGIDPYVLINNGTNYTGFRIYNRHLKFTNHPEESYMAHTQGGATNIIVSPGGIRQPATDLDNPWAFQGIIDETSFHSQNFWESSGGIDPNNFESEYPATIYGNTNALTGTRGAGATYGVGVPYPLNDPTTIGTAVGMSQYINPDRYDAVTNPGGGLEAWWRWGDTPQDCAENINDVMDHAVSTPEALVTNHHLRAVEIDQNDLYTLSTSDSTYLATSSGTTTAGTNVTEFISVIIEGLVDTACNVKNLSSPILQYLRVKFTGSGSVDLGQGKAEASLWWKKRRTK